MRVVEGRRGGEAGGGKGEGAFEEEQAAGEEAAHPRAAALRCLPGCLLRRRCRLRPASRGRGTHPLHSRTGKYTPQVSLAPSEGVHLAKLKTNSVFTAPCETSILYTADGGNMHCFTAKTACAVLDVLGPPYSDSDGRPCTYYYNLPYESFSGVAGVKPAEGEVFALLKERPKPDDCLVVAAPYKGPKIVDK